MLSLIPVLVPDADGEEALAGVPGVASVRYRLGDEPNAEQRSAEVIVVTYAHAEEAIRLMHQLPALRLVQTLNAGYDQWEGRLPPGVSLSNARGAHGHSCAEWVAAVLLARARRLADFIDAQARQVWEPRRSRSLSGQRIAVLGAGDLGGCIRRVLEPFGCIVTLVARTRRDDVIPLDTFMGARDRFDVVILAMPLSDETHHLVDAAFLDGLGDGTVVVNVGRGQLVDHEALVAATADGRLQAILDVTEPEPLPSGHALWTAANITITPHVGGGVTDVQQRAWAVAAEQIAAFASGETPSNVVIRG